MEWLLGISQGMQLSGAIILMHNSWGNVEEQAIKECFSGNSTVERDADENVAIGRESLRRAAQKVYATRISFLYIVSGYLLSFFLESSFDSWKNFGLSIWGLLFFYIAGIGLANLLAKRNYPKDVKIPYEELNKIVNVSTWATDNEIKEML